MSTESMQGELVQLSTVARRAVQCKDWPSVSACANKILASDDSNPEGFFLLGLAESAFGRPIQAASAFERALELDPGRYDAGVELANQRSVARRNGEAAALLAQYTPMLSNSPRYLDMAGTVYVNVGMPEAAWPLFEKANELQPNIDLFQANKAACAVFLGKIDDAKRIYEALLKRFPAHQKNHYEYSRLAKATDTSHVDEMKRIVETSHLPADKNIFIYYAIGKELEDLSQWDEAFEYYKMAGDAVVGVTQYDVGTDLALIERIIEVCNADWLNQESAGNETEKTPIFIVGLPRSGTTLTERIVSSHSQVQSLGETLFFPMVLRLASGVLSRERISPEIVEAAARADVAQFGRAYLDGIAYRLGTEPMFIDKYPQNILNLGFIARALPNARIIHLRRNPMDSCFSMFKQVFTWAYKFSYSLDDLGRYYVAYDRLVRHWKRLLGERLIEVNYEALVTDPENQTRELISKLGLEFEPACLEFHRNTAASTTASSVQIRERAHTRSVDRWRNFERQLAPLKARLVNAGIEID